MPLLPYNIDGVRNIFTNQDFFEEKISKEIDFPFTMHDRRRLWEVLAVLESLVDVEMIGAGHSG